jgi:tRNA pseudouridine55 synthase
MPIFDFQKGEVLLIDKPYDWTSFDAVNKVKITIRKKLRQHLPPAEKGTKVKLKVGHAGTLDPLATGLLIVCTGKETKNLENYTAQEKEYTGTFRLGATTPSFDLEKEIDATYPTEHITDSMIRDAALQFTGTQLQIPPLFSAIKVGGRRAYKIARAGKLAEIPAREIVISEFEITAIRPGEVDFRLVCSKGTYIRALARDFGAALHSGAHLSALCRTRIGVFELKNAMSLDKFEQACEESFQTKDADRISEANQVSPPAH